MPRIIGGSLAEHRTQTRLKLYKALSTLMSTRGFDGITLADIAKEAGIGRTAIYNHFQDKESLLLSFITHETDEYIAKLERSLQDIDDPVTELATYVRAQSRLKRVYHLAPGPDLRSVLSPDYQLRMRDHVTVVEKLLRDILHRGITNGDFPDQDIEVTVPLVHACLTSRSVPDDGPGRGAAVEATVAFVLRAVGVANLQLVNA